MLLPLLLIIFIGLCFTLIILSRHVKTQVKPFLRTTTTIANEKSLEDYKSAVRKCMYLTLALIGITGIAFCISVVLMWLKGIYGTVSLFLLGVTLVSTKGVGKLEEKARSLTCSNSDLERRYQEVSKIWVKQTLPNF